MASIVIRGGLAASLGACAVAAAPARASEGGSDNIGKGSEGFYAGALPDQPGLYGVVYLNDYLADRFNDGAGRSAVPDFRLDARVLVGRLYYQSPVRIAGGRLGVFAIGSIASLRLQSRGDRYRHVGFGDVTLGPVLGWKVGDLHPLVAVDLVAPVGSYDEARTLNAGINHFVVRPIVGVSYLPPGGLEMSAKVTYTISARNGATDYRSGNLFHADYSISYPVTRQLRLGLNGYALTQTTDDRRTGLKVGDDGNRGRVHAIGPALHVSAGKIGLDLRYLREFGARNRAQGNSLWLKLVAPL